MSQFLFDRKAQQFINPSGQYIKKPAVRGIVDNDIAAQKAGPLADHARRLRKYAKQLQDGEISEGEFRAEVALWKRRCKRVIKDARVNYAAVAWGGTENTPQSAWGRVGQDVRFQYERLDRFAEEILASPAMVLERQSGKMDFDERLDLYLDTAVFVFLTEQKQSHKEAGYTRVRNVPHSEESCVTSKSGIIGCTEITKMGWRDLQEDDVPPEGKRACGPMGRCGEEFDMGPVEETARFVDLLLSQDLSRVEFASHNYGY